MSSEPQALGGAFPPKRKSMAVAFFLWFFLGIFAAHKFYLGRSREGVKLILAYFLLPLFFLIAVLLGLQAAGVELLPADAKPEDIEALIRQGPFIALVAAATVVLAIIWIWDFIVLRRQVREHNARLEREENLVS